MDRDSLKALRKQFNLTQEQLGAALTPKYSRFAVNAWEKGKSRIPANIGEMLAAANLNAPAAKVAATKFIGAKTHPHCWVAAKSSAAGYHFTLAHPRWYISSDNPVLNKVPASEIVPTTIAEFEAYKPVTPEKVYATMLALGASENAIKKFMVTRGHMQFGQPKATAAERENAWVAEHGFTQASMDEFYRLNPDVPRAEMPVAPDPEAVAAIGAKLESIIKS